MWSSSIISSSSSPSCSCSCSGCCCFEDSENLLSNSRCPPSCKQTLYDGDDFGQGHEFEGDNYYDECECDADSDGHLA